jgi:hypothetical protein
MNSATPELERQMLARIRRHMLTSLVGIVLGFGGLAVSARFLGHDMEHRMLLAVLTLLSIAIIPIVGLTSTVKNLRCPACEGWVAFQASANASFFAASAPKNCRHCGKKIFGDELFHRFRRMLIVVGVGTFVLFAVAGILTMATHH